MSLSAENKLFVHSAQVVHHIRLETACSQHAQGEELLAWNQSKSEVLPLFPVSQDTA